MSALRKLAIACDLRVATSNTVSIVRPCADSMRSATKRPLGDRAAPVVADFLKKVESGIGAVAPVSAAATSSGTATQAATARVRRIAFMRKVAI